MQCPTALFDDLEILKGLTGPKLGKAKPHPDSMLKVADPDPYLEDYRYAVDWLNSNNTSKATFDSYRRDVDRLMLWMWFVRPSEDPKNRVPALFKDLHRSDIEAFVEFCKNPPMAWRGTETKRRFLKIGGERIPNPEWRPFVARVAKQTRLRAITATREGEEASQRAFEEAQPDVSNYELKPASIKVMYACLGSLWKHLISTEYVDRDPVALVKSKKKKGGNKDTLINIKKERARKRLNAEQIQACLKAIDNMAPDLSDDEYARNRFLLVCITGLYLRVSEVASKDYPTHANFSTQVHQVDGNRVRSWWFDTKGKGDKNRSIPVPESVLRELARYRLTQGLPAQPNGEQSPLFPKARGQGGLTSTRHVREILQRIFNGAYEILMAQKMVEDANALQSCTVHWLRHTGISEDARNRPMNHVQDAAGHGSMDTTLLYVHSDLVEQYLSSNQSDLWKGLNE
ncbi:tyrosine-type recombinase/integrase [Pseudomonas aeruginosa]